jgi:hypothetical protein
MCALAAALTAASGRYGYHRDELYFRMLKPAWGYVDQPPLAPAVARGTRWIADQPWAMRLPATAACVASVFVLVLIVRELGGGRLAQTLCAWGYAFASLPLIMGHALLTSTLDLPVWPAVVLFAVRAQRRAEPRWWLAVGAVAGLSTYNKLLVAVLLAALAAGVVAAGPRALAGSRWVWAAAALAVVLALPNLAYQAANGWPQLSVGKALAAENATTVRVMEFPFLFLILGPPLVPIWMAGLVGLFRRPDWRSIRFVGAAFPILLVIVFVMGAQFYYPFGLLAAVFAIGCVPAAEWAARGTRRTRLLAAAVAVNAAVSVVLGLPVVRLETLGSTPIPGINQIARDTVGWPQYVAQIASVYRSLPSADQHRATVVTSNYGEAGAVARYGPAEGLPAAYSGLNGLYEQGPPPSGASVVLFVGGQVKRAAALFGSCTVAGTLDNEFGVDNEEQGEPVAICRQPSGGWSAVWPRLRHLG